MSETIHGQARQRQQREEREYRFDEARFLIGYGVPAGEIAQRLGTTREALERQAYRWGAHDIADHMRGSSRSRPRTACVDCGGEASRWTASGRCRRCWEAARMARGWMAGAA